MSNAEPVRIFCNIRAVANVSLTGCIFDEECKRPGSNQSCRIIK